MVYGPALPPGGLPSGRRGIASQAADSDGPRSKAAYGAASPSGSSNGAEPYELTNAWPLDVTRVGCGLHNLGNSCYLNSVLQCLTHLPPLAALACSKYHPPHGCRAGGQDRCIFCILCIRIRMSLRPKAQQSSEPRRLWNRLQLLGRQFEQGRQEDAHELLRCLVDACERDLLKHEGRWVPHKHIPDPDTAVNRLFQGTLRSQVRCGACGHESNTYDPFMDLSLDLPAPVHSLAEALQRFTAPEHLDAANRYRCGACKGLVPARKQITIHHPPNCLVVHLKRFDPSGLGAKVTRNIQFPDTLPLHAYLSHPPSATTLPGPSPRPHPPTRSHPAAPDAHYTLHGVLVHQGFSSHSGHYYAFVRSGDARPSWWCMNDSLVSPCSLDNVKSQQAYMLFYVASHMHPLPPTPPPTPDPPASAPTAAPAPRPSSPASSTASAPAIIGPAPRPITPAAANGAPARVFGPHLPSSAAHPPPAAAAASHPPTPTRPPDPHPNGAAAPPSCPPGSPPAANGSGTGDRSASVGMSAARVQASVTHFAPMQRRPLTKQGIAQQRTAGSAPAGAPLVRPVIPGAPLVKPVIPEAVLRLTQRQQPELQQEQQQGPRAEESQQQQGQAQAAHEPGAAQGAAGGGGQDEKGVRENANGHAGCNGTDCDEKNGNAGATPADGSRQPLPQQQQQQQEPQPAANGGAAAKAAAGGARAGRKRRITEVELGQEPAAVEGKRVVKQKLLGALRQHSWLDLVRQHIRRCCLAGESQEAAIKSARGLRAEVPAEMKQLGLELLREVMERAADQATGRPACS